MIDGEGPKILRREDIELPPFQFPYHLGPSTRGLGTSILYHRGMACTSPGWFSPVLQTVVQIQQEAKGTIMEVLLAAALDVVLEAQRNARRVSDDFVALKPHFKQIHVVYSAAPDAYKPWEAISPEVRALVEAELQHPEGLVVANTELCARTWELSLLGLSPKEVVDVLIERAMSCPTPLSFFAECFLNRLTLPTMHPETAIITTTQTFVDLLAAFGSNGVQSANTLEVRREQIVFALFEELLGPYVGSIDTQRNAEALKRLIDEQEDAIGKFKVGLSQRASILLGSANDEVALRALLRETVESLEPELAEIANADRAAVKRLGQRVTESPSLWATIGSLVGVALSTLPAVVPAAFAIPALSALGASALASKRERDARVRTSPWSLVYHAKRVLDR